MSSIASRRGQSGTWAEAEVRVGRGAKAQNTSKKNSGVVWEGLNWCVMCVMV